MNARYFDFAATTPIRDCALQAMIEALQAQYANPSSPHHAGRLARSALESARARLLQLLHCSDGQLLLCSSASEAVNQVLQHVLQRSDQGTIVCAGNVHACIDWLADYCPERYRRVPVNSDGQIAEADLMDAIDADTALVCLSHVCHETGAIQQVEALSAACGRRSVPCLVDGVQAVGHIPLQIDALQADWYVWSAHKFGGPPGVAGIFMQGETPAPFIRGGAQEFGLRAGTENLPAVCGAVAALEEAISELASAQNHLRACCTLLHDELRQALPAVRFPGSGAAHYPGICACTLPGIEARMLIEGLSIEGFYAASGSACTADRVTPSSTLCDMGLSEADALATLRISFAAQTELNSINELVSAITRMYQHLSRK